MSKVQAQLGDSGGGGGCGEGSGAMPWESLWYGT